MGEAEGSGERMTERADTIAYLEQRRDNAAAVLAAHPEGSEEWVLAKDRCRQIEVIRDDLSGGMHEGAAWVRDAMSGEEA